MLEKDFTKKIRKEFEKRGAFIFKSVGGPYQVPGLPDLIGSYEGRFFAIETKLRDNEMNINQTLMKNEITKKEKSKGIYFLIQCFKKGQSENYLVFPYVEQVLKGPRPQVSNSIFYLIDNLINVITYLNSQLNK